MSFFRRTSPGPADLDRVRAEIGRLNETLERYGERAKQFEDTLASGPDTAALTGRLDALDEAVAQRSTGPAHPDDRIDALAAQIAALEARITAVSTELANQLSELGGDIETLQRPGTSPADEAVVDELRGAQSRLASEQARYQIAFREDLARLAEQLRRPSPAEPRRSAR